VAGAKKPELVAKLIPGDAKDINKAVEAQEWTTPSFSALSPLAPAGVDAGAGGGADSGGEAPRHERRHQEGGGKVRPERAHLQRPDRAG